MATTKQMLDEARKAYHSLQTGTMPRVVVDQNGERVEFTAANATKLAGYITELELKLGNCVGGVNAVDIPATYGPATFTF